MWEIIINFAKTNWLALLSFVVSIIGAASWFPVLSKSRKIRKRKIIGTIVDHRVISDAKVQNASGVEKAKGTILMIAVNLFVAHESFFVYDCKAEVQLHDGKVYKGNIVDGVLSEKTSGTTATFTCPKEYNFNLHREIIAEKDNIRIISLMIENSDFHCVDEVQQIKFIFESGAEKALCSKTVIFTRADFPELNHMNFIDSLFLKPGTISTFRR
jgi:hypothetical protein